MASDKDLNSSPETSQSKPEVGKNVPEVSDHASQILSDMVNAFNEENKSPADVKAVMEMAKAAVPELTPQQAEIVTTVLVEISGIVTPEIVQETVEIAAEVTPGFSYYYLSQSNTQNHTLIQCFSTAGTHPGTGTWRPSFWDLNYF